MSKSLIIFCLKRLLIKHAFILGHGLNFLANGSKFCITLSPPRTSLPVTDRSIKFSISTDFYFHSLLGVNSWQAAEKYGIESDLFGVFNMESGESVSTLEKIAEIPKESIESRETSAEFNNIQDGGHVVSSVVATTLQQNPLGFFVTPASVAQVGK